MQNRSGKQNDSLFKPWHLIIVVLLLGAACVYSYGAMKTAYTVDPKKVFAEFFTNSLTRVTDLQGDGTVSSMSDIWLTFYCADVVRFREPQFATLDRADRSWHYFSEHLPHDKDVSNLADLEAWTFYDHPDPVRLVNAWLLHNKKSNKYFFRTWGRK